MERTIEGGIKERKQGDAVAGWGEQERERALGWMGRGVLGEGATLVAVYFLMLLHRDVTQKWRSATAFN